MSNNKTVLISSLTETNSLTSFTPESSNVKKEPLRQAPRASLFQELKSNDVSNDNSYLSLAKPLFRQIDILLILMKLETSVKYTLYSENLVMILLNVVLI